jgi:predicted lipoprotein with Yx(FWY)xxD motif
MKNHHTAVVSSAIALTSFLAVGAGTALDTAAGATNVNVSTTVHAAPSSVKPVFSRPNIVKMPTIHTAMSNVNGKAEIILVNSQGLPLYYYAPDTAKKSLVNGELARLWPPLLSAHPTAIGARGVLTSLKVTAGEQVTYNGHFLYTFVEDSHGHVSGQGVSNFLVATPRLKAIGAGTVTPMSPASSSGNGYPY